MKCKYIGARGISICVNEDNPLWKGDLAGYGALHNWIRRHKPKPSLCENCKIKPPYDLANLNNHNYRRDVDDYVWLCRKCHNSMDRQKTFVKGVCPICNKYFKKRKGAETKHCSKRCADLSYKTGMMLECKYCGVKFYMSGIYIKRERKYCSQKCYFGDKNERKQTIRIR